MKKFIASALACVLGLTLVSCAGSNDAENTNESENNAAEEQSEESGDETESEAEESEEAEDADSAKEDEAAAEDDSVENSDNSSSETELKLNEEIEFNDFKMTVKGFDLIKAENEAAKQGAADEDTPTEVYVLRMTYDWENTSDETKRPYSTYEFNAYQDGDLTTFPVIETDEIDDEIRMQEVEPGEKVEGAQAAVGIDDANKPVELVLNEFLSTDGTTYTLTIDDVNNIGDLSTESTETADAE